MIRAHEKETETERQKDRETEREAQKREKITHDSIRCYKVQSICIHTRRCRRRCRPINCMCDACINKYKTRVFVLLKQVKKPIDLFIN